MHKNIAAYTIFHIHWLNGVYYPYLVDWLKADGVYQEPEMGYVGDFIEAVTSIVKGIKHWLR
jgi:hypothetical protein